MKRPIITWIDCEDERCGECKCHALAEYDYDTAWCAWSELRGPDGGERFRGPECHAAEKLPTTMLNLLVDWNDHAHGIGCKSERMLVVETEALLKGIKEAGG